jgi:hypothetical protein
MSRRHAVQSLAPARWCWSAFRLKVFETQSSVPASHAGSIRRLRFFGGLKKSEGGIISRRRKLMDRAAFTPNEPCGLSISQARSFALKPRQEQLSMSLLSANALICLCIYFALSELRNSCITTGQQIVLHSDACRTACLAHGRVRRSFRSRLRFRSRLSFRYCPQSCSSLDQHRAAPIHYTPNRNVRGRWLSLFCENRK